MNTTHDTEPTGDATSDGADAPHATALESLAAADPADAPGPAEALAAKLAADLEGVSPVGQPEQLEAPFSGRTEDAT